MSAAVTGQAFAPSYRFTRQVLAQSGWKMLTVDALASHTCSTCAGVVGFLIGSISYAVTSAGMHWSNVAHGQSWSIAAAVVSGTIAYAIFQLFASLIVNILDSLCVAVCHSQSTQHANLATQFVIFRAVTPFIPAGTSAFAQTLRKIEEDSAGAPRFL